MVRSSAGSAFLVIRLGEAVKVEQFLDALNSGRASTRKSNVNYRCLQIYIIVIHLSVFVHCVCVRVIIHLTGYIMCSVVCVCVCVCV